MEIDRRATADPDGVGQTIDLEHDRVPDHLGGTAQLIEVVTRHERGHGQTEVGE